MLLTYVCIVFGPYSMQTWRRKDLGDFVTCMKSMSVSVDRGGEGFSTNEKIHIIKIFSFTKVSDSSAQT